MINEDLKNILKAGGKELGVVIGDKELSSFLLYLKELKEWNKKINLTAIRDDKDIVIRHFFDSLILVPFLSSKETLLDIGSGAGFPGIPLKIVIPDLKVTLMDSVNKKVVFMRHIIRTIGLKNIEAVRGRAEDKETIRKFAACFDVVTSRAFTGLGSFLDMATPYTKKGGILLAVKGPKWMEELKGLKGLKGIKTTQIKETSLPFSDITTTVLIFKTDG